jgi:YggT family protein
MNQYFTNPLDFILQTLFTLYTSIFMIRLMLQMTQADFYNPLSQFVVKATSPLLTPVRRFVPSIGRFDSASLVVMMLLQMAFWILYRLIHGTPDFLPMLALSVKELVDILLNIYQFAILIMVIVSWITPGVYNPVIGIINTILEPIMRPCRKLLPPVSGIDFSPLIAILGIVVARMLIIPPLVILANQL